MGFVTAAFGLTSDSEVSIEVDPRTVTPQRLAHFRTLGFNQQISELRPDRIALPDDSLAAAQREGRPHRNFQGCSTQADGDLIARGVSSIGRVGSLYDQNAKTLPEYCESVLAGQLPIVRGYAMNEDARVRRDVIMAIMCRGRVDFGRIESAHGIRVVDPFADKLRSLKTHAASGLVDLDPGDIEVTTTGRFLVRAIAMVSDRHLQQATERPRFSRVV